MDLPLLTPDATRRPGVAGVEAALGDGRAWTLALPGLDPALDEARDALFDAAAARGVYRECDVDLARVAAMRLLLRAHDIEASAAFALVRDADDGAIVRAVEAAFFGGSIGSYSEWARVSIRAAGIDPAALDPAEVGPLLAELERQRRTPPRGLIPSVRVGIHRQKRAALLKRKPG